MLHEKDTMFNWVIPNTTSQGRAIKEDFRINCKHNYLYVGSKFVDRHYKGTDLNDLRVAFVNLDNGDNPFLVINPVNISYQKIKELSESSIVKQSPLRLVHTEIQTATQRSIII
jgi:hypothetical protein